MARTIAFLRAINVGGHTVKMDALRQIFEGLGFSGVETFIASGNVVFETPIQDTRSLEKEIENRLRDTLGYEVATFVRTEAELAQIADYKPFPQSILEAAAALNVAFLTEPLDEEAQQKLMALRTDIDDFHVHERQIYWSCRKKQSESTFSNAVLEKTLGRPSTLRGANTVKQMAEKYASHSNPGLAQAERLARVGDQLASLLRGPDAARRAQVLPGAEEWSAMQVLGHMAEMIPYWLEQCRRLIAASGEPPQFGRTLEAAERLAGVERGAAGQLDEILDRVEHEIQAATQAIRQIPASQSARVGIHLRYGEMTVEQVIERFIVAHAEEHLAQVQAALRI